MKESFIWPLSFPASAALLVRSELLGKNLILITVTMLDYQNHIPKNLHFYAKILQLDIIYFAYEQLNSQLLKFKQQTCNIFRPFIFLLVSE